MNLRSPSQKNTPPAIRRKATVAAGASVGGWLNQVTIFFMIHSPAERLPDRIRLPPSASPAAGCLSLHETQAFQSSEQRLHGHIPKRSARYSRDSENHFSMSPREYFPALGGLETEDR